MNRNAILLRNSVFFYLSFYSAGTQTIVTQMYLLKYYPALKGILLPAILLSGALCGITGAFVSRRYLQVKASALSIGLLFAVHLVAFLGVLNAGPVVLYTLCYVVGCFLMSFLQNYLDAYYARTADAASLNWHIRSLLLFSMLSFIVSPLFFAAGGTGYLSTVAVTLLAVLTGIPALVILARSMQAGPEAAHGVTPRQEQPAMVRKEKLALAYILLFFTVVTIFLSMVTYIMSDYYQFDGYRTKAGINLTVTAVAACLGVLLLKPLRNNEAGPTGPDPYFRLRLQLAITGTAFAMGLLMLLKLMNSFLYFLFISVTLGYVYGLFLSSTRQYAVTVSNHRSNTLFLTIYNNGQSISFVAGNILLACIWLVQKATHLDYYLLLFLSLLAIVLAEGVILIRWRARL